MLYGGNIKIEKKKKYLKLAIRARCACDHRLPLWPQAV